MSRVEDTNGANAHSNTEQETHKANAQPSSEDVNDTDAQHTTEEEMPAVGAQLSGIEEMNDEPYGVTDVENQVLIYDGTFVGTITFIGDSTVMNHDSYKWKAMGQNKAVRELRKYSCKSTNCKAAKFARKVGHFKFRKESEWVVEYRVPHLCENKPLLLKSVKIDEALESPNICSSDASETMHDADPNKADQSFNKPAASSVSGNTEMDSNTIEQEYSSTLMDNLNNGQESTQKDESDEAITGSEQTEQYNVQPDCSAASDNLTVLTEDQTDVAQNDQSEVESVHETEYRPELNSDSERRSVHSDESCTISVHNDVPVTVDVPIGGRKTGSVYKEVPETGSFTGIASNTKHDHNEASTTESGLFGSTSDLSLPSSGLNSFANDSSGSLASSNSSDIGGVCVEFPVGNSPRKYSLLQLSALPMVPGKGIVAEGDIAVIVCNKERNFKERGHFDCFNWGKMSKGKLKKIKIGTYNCTEKSDGCTASKRKWLCSGSCEFPENFCCTYSIAGFESLVILYTNKHSHSPKETNLVRLEDIADENSDIETQAENSPVSSTPIRSSNIEKVLPEDEEGNAEVIENLTSSTTIDKKLRSSFADPKFFCFKSSSINNLEYKF